MSRVELSLWTPTVDGRREFNPYLRIGGFELCIDRDGFAVYAPRRTFGFIRNAGWHHSKHGDAA